MDIEFTVNLQQGGAPPAPRFENADYLMASGIAGSIDEAFRDATTNLVRWLEQKYGLNAAEVSSVLANGDGLRRRRRWWIRTFTWWRRFRKQSWRG